MTRGHVSLVDQGKTPVGFLLADRASGIKRAPAFKPFNHLDEIPEIIVGGSHYTASALSASVRIS